ncbi:Wzz/FepE/Etk N-terminal domain-containing protein [Shewanella gaetbuli]
MFNEIKKVQIGETISNQHPNDEIDLLELFSVIWKGKWIIIIITAFFAAGSVAYAIKQPNIYKSTTLLAPVDSEQSNSRLAALTGQFSGLASGINLCSGSSDKTQVGIEVLKSLQFTSEFVQKHQILPELLAVEHWDLPTNRLKFNKNLYDVKTKKWVRKVTAPFEPEPSMLEAYEEFKRIVNIQTDKENGMILLSVEHKSPFIAKAWTELLIQDINTIMKERDVAEANKSIEFLRAQIQQTNIADIRTILFKLIEEQAKIIMFAKVRDEYIFKTIDPAFIPEVKTRPKRALICVLGTLLGAMLATMLVLIRHFCKQ